MEKYNFYTEMTNLLPFTVNVHKSHRQAECISQLACGKIVCFRMIFETLLRTETKLTFLCKQMSFKH